MGKQLAESFYEEEVRTFQVEKITVRNLSFENSASDEGKKACITSVPESVERACP